MSLCYVYVSKTEKHSVACPDYVSDANEVFDLNGAPQIIQRQTQGVILALSFSCSTLNHMNTVFIIRGHRTTSYPAVVNAVAKNTVSQVIGRVSQLAFLHLFLMTTPVCSPFDSPSVPLKMQF